MKSELDFDYRVGDAVYCVNDKQTNMHVAFLFQQWPQKDNKYIVRKFAENDGIVTGVYLEELHNKPIFIDLLKREQEPAYSTWRFRKAETTLRKMHANFKNILGNTEKVKTYEKIKVHI